MKGFTGKRELATVAAFFMVWVALYFMISFVSLEHNPSSWHIGGRFFYVLIGTSLSVIVSFTTYEAFENERN